MYALTNHKYQISEQKPIIVETSSASLRVPRSKQLITRQSSAHLTGHMHRYRRSPDMVDSIYARDEDETMLYRRQVVLPLPFTNMLTHHCSEPVNLSKLRIGVPVHRFDRRAPEPEPFVIFSKAS